MNHPIMNIEWMQAGDLHANDYNPNVVYNKELALLKLSLLQNGWIQPILATTEREIIDGFHRWSLAKNDKEVNRFTDGKVPVVVIDLSPPERMMLTVRMNRAKGSHIAARMSNLVKTVIKEHGYTVEMVCERIGATKDEVELLLMDGVFQNLDIQNHKYSKAWIPA